MIAQNLLISIRTTIVLAALTGLLFPALITGIAQLAFPFQANGSLILDEQGTVRGSTLIGQTFTDARYFHTRPSAAGSGYAGESSAGTNLAPTSKKLIFGQPDDPATRNMDESFNGVKQLAERYRQENNLPADQLVPVDAVTRSGSGLDPHISTKNAKLQSTRILKARPQLSPDELQRLIDECTDKRQFDLFGEPGVNVVSLNWKLDKAQPLPSRISTTSAK